MGRAVEIRVTQRQRAILERWVRKKATTPHRLVERCRIVLLSADGVANIEQGRLLGIDRQRARRWRRRWAEAQERFLAAEREGATEGDLRDLIAGVLGDAERAGAPATFTAEQLARILAVACEPPADSGRPVTHWTPRELADEVTRRGIVESISPRHVDRLLKRGLSDRTRAGTG